MATLSEELRSYSSVVVTGGSSGIGKSFIKLMHKLHPDLRFCNLSRTEPDIKIAGLMCQHVPIDLGNAQEIAPVADTVRQWLEADPAGKGILLINNSGFGGYGIFPEPGIEHQTGMIDVNVRALVELTSRLLPTLRARGGAIINLASTAAFQPTPWMATYGATKAFVLHWSLALDQELWGSGVRSLAVCPGPTSTEFFRRAGLQEGSVADSMSVSSEFVVLAALRALAAGRSQVVTGWKNWVAVALVTKLPKPMAAWLTAKVLARFRLKQVSR